MNSLDKAQIELESLSSETREKSLIIARLNAELFGQRKQVAKLKKQLKAAKATGNSKNTKGSSNKK